MKCYPFELAKQNSLAVLRFSIALAVQKCGVIPQFAEPNAYFCYWWTDVGQKQLRSLPSGRADILVRIISDFLLRKKKYSYNKHSAYKTKTHLREAVTQVLSCTCSPIMWKWGQCCLLGHFVTWTTTNLSAQGAARRAKNHQDASEHVTI